MKRIIVFFASLICLEVMGFAQSDEPTPIDPEKILKSVQFDYTITYKDNRAVECKGLLTLTINIPVGTDRVITEYSKHHERYRGRKPMLLFKHWDNPDYNDTTYIWSIDNYTWADYFRFIVYPTKEGTGVKSPTYSIDDFIDADDLKALEEYREWKNSSSVSEIQDDPVQLIFDAGALDVVTSTAGHLSVTDLYGRRLYAGDISDPCSVPLDLPANTIIVARFTADGKSYSRKFISR